MSIYDSIDAKSLKQTTDKAIKSIQENWTSLTNKVETAKADLTKMLGDKKPTAPYNTGSDLGGTSVELEDLSVNTPSAIVDPTIVADIDSVNVSEAGDASDYNILYYPEELLAEGNLGKRYPHAMGIFLNVNSKSKLGKYMEQNGQITQYRLDGGHIELGDNTNGSGIGTGAAQSFLDEQGVIAKFKRFTGCIMLPLPLDINVGYAAKYNTTGAGGALGTALKAGLNGSNFKDFMEGAAPEIAKAFGRDLVKSAGSNFLDMLGSVDRGSVNNPGGIFDKVLGTVRNPRTEQVFDSIEMRVFSFQWQINISTIKEWNTIRKIVSLLKENMHPELDIQEQGTYMVMPNEFDVEFYEKVDDMYSESYTIPKIATSVLANLEVNYTPQGNWIAFEGTMIPPFVVIRMVFKEMEPLHRGMVRDVGKSNDKFSPPDSYFGDKRRGF